MYSVRHGSGRPLLLVHGLGSSHRNWDPIIATLAEEREVIAVDLPGFGRTPPLPGRVTIASLTDAVQRFTAAEGLDDVDLVGSSMGARMVLEMACRAHEGNVVALDPGGFWTTSQARIFGASVKASVALVRLLRPRLPALSASPIGRTALLAQFSRRPWRLRADLVAGELRGFATSPSFDEALAALVKGPKQRGAPAGSLRSRVVIGWGRQDRVTLPSQAARAMALFPDATLHWFNECGHFPHWDQPAQAAEVILNAARSPTRAQLAAARS